MYIELTESVGTIESKINAALAEEINLLLSKKKVRIESKCKSLVANWILSQPEIVSLQTPTLDSLAGQFGIIRGMEETAVKDIISAIEDSVYVRLKKVDKKLNGGLEAFFQPNTFVNLLGLTSGHVYYERGDLHWLSWLLEEGDNVIVVNYTYNPGTGLGRSRLGNMQEGGAFRVPPEFSGNIRNNFITRALIGTTQEKDIFDVIKRELS